MDAEGSINTLRSRASALVLAEALLISEALELSRQRDSAQAVDELLGKAQGIRMERSRLREQLGYLLGDRRMHVASEVWRPGVYEYRMEVGDPPVAVRVRHGPTGIEVVFPHARDAVSIGTLRGSFDGPISPDSARGFRGERTMGVSSL